MKKWIFFALTLVLMTGCQIGNCNNNPDWVSGCDYIPSNAVNQLEMWQEETFSPDLIDKELGWAEDLGFNLMRVFLHHKLWEQDARGFKKRINRYLDIASSHGIRTMFVFLDDCWNETCETGPQPAPLRGVHNSGWCKDPGALYFGLCGSGVRYAEDTTAILKVLEAYVKDILKEFKNDRRIHSWDLYNEPGGGQDPYRYWERSFPLLKDVFRWAREVNPSQPLTAGVWNSRLGEMNVWQLENSDIITYHTYEPLESHKAMVDTLKRYGKPMVCTEYMARTQNSTFQTILPMLKKNGVGAINWGFVSGKTNTIFAWDTPLDVDEPTVWFHDILRQDGTPYSEEEVALIREINGKTGPRTAAAPVLPLIPYPNRVTLKRGSFHAGAATVNCSPEFSSEAAEAVKAFGGELASSAEGSGCISFKFDASLADEAYELNVSGRNATVKASGFAGVVNALATLRQLLSAEGELPCCEIADAPRFSWRGAHLDCSRHFFSVEEVKKYLRVMSLYKLNRFHWHLTDDHGWRVEIKRYPKLTEIGAWRNGTMVGHDMQSNDGIRYGGFYTQEQIREIVAYAASLGIEVVPEIDLPAHLTSALAAYPWLGCTGGPYSVFTIWDISPEVLCAGKETSFEFLENVFAEICELFPYKYIHIGGDECPKKRWKECPRCQAKIKELGLSDTEHASAETYLQNYVTARVQKILADKGRSVIGWDEILEGDLAPGATVMSWRGTKGGIQAASRGFDVIMTPCDYCYLDYSQSANPAEEPDGIGHFVSLEKCYSYEPLRGIPADAAGRILGLQGNVWTEFIATMSHAEYMLLPRMLALSEVMWCHPDIKDWRRFYTTLTQQEIPRLQALGYNYRAVAQ